MKSVTLLEINELLIGIPWSTSRRRRVGLPAFRHKFDRGLYVLDLRHPTGGGRNHLLPAATAALTVNCLQLGQTLPGSPTGIRGWEPVGDRKVA